MQLLDLGLIDYKTSLEKQIELTNTLSNQLTHNPNHPGYLIICTHPPIVTLGSKTEPQDVFAWKGPVLEVSRGGRATYHGPSQIVAYPIISLKTERKGRKPQEVWGLIRAIESSIIETLNSFGIKSTGRSLQQKNEEQNTTEETGVWINNRKVASVGIGVRNWISYHGLALNVDHDPNAFIGMNPCGFNSSVMTSIEEVLGQKPDRETIKSKLIENMNIYI